MIVTSLHERTASAAALMSSEKLIQVLLGWHQKKRDVHSVTYMTAEVEEKAGVEGQSG
jgi:hypothetical protein